MRKILKYTIKLILNIRLGNTKIRYNSSIFSIFLSFLYYYLNNDIDLLRVQYKTIGVRLKLE